MQPENIVTLAGAVLLFLGTVVTVLGTRGKTRADARAALDARIDERLKGELNRVDDRLEAVETELELEREWNRLLIDHIYKGLPPPPPARPIRAS